MSMIAIPDRFTTLPDERAQQASVVALEEHGFSVEVVGDLDAASQAVPARPPRCPARGRPSSAGTPPGLQPAMTSRRTGSTSPASKRAGGRSWPRSVRCLFI